VLPGVGAFADCRQGARFRSTAWLGSDDRSGAGSRRGPFFGICVGMQLMATRGKEHVVTDGF